MSSIMSLRVPLTALFDMALLEISTDLFIPTIYCVDKKLTASRTTQRRSNVQSATLVFIEMFPRARTTSLSGLAVEDRHLTRLEALFSYFFSGKRER